MDRATFGLDELEPRRLLADASGIVKIEWRGQEIEMRQGEWIVALTRPDPTYDEDTERWTYDLVPSRSTTPTESLDSALDAAKEIGVEFKKYLGLEDLFLVKVPDDVSYQQLLAVIDDVPGFEYMEPNGIMRSGDMTGVPRVSPEEETTPTPEASEPDVTEAQEQAAPSTFVMPSKTFSDDRVGSGVWAALDAGGDDDLLNKEHDPLH
jgi:hypothetical protein